MNAGHSKPRENSQWLDKEAIYRFILSGLLLNIVPMQLFWAGSPSLIAPYSLFLMLPALIYFPFGFMVLPGVFWLTGIELIQNKEPESNLRFVLTIGLGLLSLAWFAFGLNDGLMRYGPVFPLGTAIQSVILFALILTLVRLGYRKRSDPMIFASHWLTIFWLGWVAFPWLGEGL